MIYFIDHILCESTVIEGGHVIQADELEGPRQIGHAYDLVLPEGAVRLLVDENIGEGGVRPDHVLTLGYHFGERLGRPESVSAHVYGGLEESAPRQPTA